MIHEILKILDTTDLQELEKQRITTDLLRLFNVVGRSELLAAFLDWLIENPDKFKPNIPHLMLADEFLKSRQ